MSNGEYKKENVLEVHNLQIKYGNKKIFDKVSFDIKKGERVWIRGKNGSGKSSIIKLIIGEEINYSGYIKKVNKVSYISQETSHLKGSLDDYIKNENLNNIYVKSNLLKLGLEKIQFEKEISKWSEGQKKKLLIAKSLCEEADLYIWDEPLNFIDVISRMQIEDLILSKKPTMLFVEHDFSFGEKIATKIIEL